MRRSNPDSRIEIWSAAYINRPKERGSEDINAVIIQVETGNGDGDYIVEVVDGPNVD